MQTLSGHRGGLKNVELLPSAGGGDDGGAPQRLLSAAFDGTIRAWDLTQAVPRGRVVHTDRNLVRMRVVPPPANSGNEKHGLVMSMRDGSLVLIHDLDLNSAASLPDFETAALSEEALPVLFDRGMINFTPRPDLPPRFASDPRLQSMFNFLRLDFLSALIRLHIQVLCQALHSARSDGDSAHPIMVLTRPLLYSSSARISSLPL
jgi:hypothetical protein